MLFSWCPSCVIFFDVVCPLFKTSVQSSLVPCALHQLYCHMITVLCYTDQNLKNLKKWTPPPPPKKKKTFKILSLKLFYTLHSAMYKFYHSNKLVLCAQKNLSLKFMEQLVLPRGMPYKSYWKSG